jgi:glycosyltransferase involved in cell wall biosynthesis
MSENPKPEIRLLAITHSLSDVDGVGRYAVSVLREATRFCKEIEVLLSRKHRGISTDLPSGIRVKAILPPDYFMYMSWPRFSYFALSCLPQVWFSAQRANIVHCLCDYPFSLFAGWAGKKKARKPVIVSGHGTYSVAPFRYKIHRSLIRKSYARADAVLFGSDFARMKFEENLSLPNVGVVDYGVYASEFMRGAPPPTQKVEKPYILGVGEVKERKGYEISVRSFMEAAQKIPSLTFAIVGRYGGDDPYFLKISNLLKQEGLEERVVFLGNVSEREKRSLYSHCEAFILTPKESAEGGFEALGLVYLEAGASGVPVIGTYDSGAVCAIRHEENGFLIHPDRPGEGADAICKILEDPSLKRRMGEKGRQMALEREWARVGEKLEQIYNRLLCGEKAFSHPLSG